MANKGDNNHAGKRLIFRKWFKTKSGKVVRAKGKGFPMWVDYER